MVDAPLTQFCHAITVRGVEAALRLVTPELARARVAKSSGDLWLAGARSSAC